MKPRDYTEEELSRMGIAQRARHRRRMLAEREAAESKPADPIPARQPRGKRAK